MPLRFELGHFEICNKILRSVNVVVNQHSQLQSIVRGLQGRWCPQSAIFYNLLFFGCLIWATHNTESDEPLQFKFLSDRHLVDASQRFSGILMIANLIFRLFSTKYLVKIGQQRGGTLATLFPSGAGEFGRQQYEDISYPVPQNNDFAGI
ncbi:Protein of unknown function [Cotesia congregata]|uniref:Uncharacterized protein n=1 Tax=Cotesia congregata TaxID=51543 RepID=A0A8J2HAQ3_COTCN|nr:Protein of unknown function [Cotesia congregata]